MNIKGKITFNVSFTAYAKQKVQHIIYGYKIYFHKRLYLQIEYHRRMRLYTFEFEVHLLLYVFLLQK